jgi:hypothetical protein
MSAHNGHNGKTSPFVTVARDVSQVAHDFVELAELQAALARIELSGWWKQFILPTVLIVVGSVLGLICLPILLAAAAMQLSVAAEISLPLALLIVGAGTGAMGLVVILVAYTKFKNMRGPLQESRQELSRNLRWIKRTLKGSNPAKSATNPQPMDH